MGHITRDIAIAKELRRQNADVDIVWLAHPLATKVLQQAEEKLLPASHSSADYNQAALPALTNFSLNLMKYIRATKDVNWKQILSMELKKLHGLSITFWLIITRQYNFKG